MGAAWDKALAADRPVVLEVKTDPDVPPLPPHIGFEQAKTFMNTTMRGDPQQGHMLKDVASQMLASVLPLHRDR
jgi:pyruvate dehydrogenase (quinone)